MVESSRGVAWLDTWFQRWKPEGTGCVLRLDWFGEIVVRTRIGHRGIGSGSTALPGALELFGGVFGGGICSTLPTLERDRQSSIPPTSADWYHRTSSCLPWMARFSFPRGVRQVVPAIFQRRDRFGWRRRLRGLSRGLGGRVLQEMFESTFEVFALFFRSPEFLLQGAILGIVLEDAVFQGSDLTSVLFSVKFVVDILPTSGHPNHHRASGRDSDAETDSFVQISPAASLLAWYSRDTKSREFSSSSSGGLPKLELAFGEILHSAGARQGNFGNNHVFGSKDRGNSTRFQERYLGRMRAAVPTEGLLEVVEVHRVGREIAETLPVVGDGCGLCHRRSPAPEARAAFLREALSFMVTTKNATTLPSMKRIQKASQT